MIFLDFMGQGLCGLRKKTFFCWWIKYQKFSVSKSLQKHNPKNSAENGTLKKQRTAGGLYRTHMVPDRQGSAAHEIPNHWISPRLRYITVILIELIFDDVKSFYLSFYISRKNDFFFEFCFSNSRTMDPWNSKNWLWKISRPSNHLRA